MPDLTHTPPPYLRERGGVAWLEVPLGKARAVFSTRIGGRSTAAGRDTLNLAPHADDAPALALANREVFCEAVGASLDSLVLVRQIHGAEILLVDASSAGERTRGQEATLAEADGLVRARSEPGLVVQVADCGPVAIADPITGAGAMVHAGWRGAAAGIVGNAVREVARISGRDPAHLTAAIGPCIRGCCYEVGNEVRDAFLARDAGFGECFAREDGSWRLDLARAIARDLRAAGLHPESVADTEACTHCRQDLFFSYRRDGQASGRLWGCLL